MEERLATYKGQRLDLVFPLNDPPITIGRAPDNKIQLDHDRVSRHHAVLKKQVNAWSVQDQASANGVLVNGQRVQHAILKEGDHIQIGPFDLVFETHVDGRGWTPTYIIAFESDVNHKTLHDEKPPK